MDVHYCPSCGKSLAHSAPGPQGEWDCDTCGFVFRAFRRQPEREEIRQDPSPGATGVGAWPPSGLASFLAGGALILLLILVSYPAFRSARTSDPTPPALSERVQGPRPAPERPRDTAAVFGPSSLSEPLSSPQAPGKSADGQVADLAAGSAILVLESSPPGAHVQDAQGITYGYTPLLLRLPAGFYRFRFSHDAHEERTEEITLTAGARARLHSVLPKLPGQITLESQPPRAQVYWNEGVLGRTPLTLTASDGSEVDVTLYREGYVPLSLSARATAGRRVVVRGILRAGGGVAPTADPGLPPAMPAVAAGLGDEGPTGPARGGVDAGGGASLSGVITLRGGAPPLEFLQVTQDRDVCGPGLKLSEEIITGGEGTLKNVVVSLDGVPSGSSAGSSDGLPPLVLDVVSCTFVPHVQAGRVGQGLRVQNSDPIPHEVVIRGEDGLPPQTLTGVGLGVSHRLERPGILEITEGSGRDWMKGYVVVFDHPYHAVTDRAGRFQLDGVPAGDYRLRAWHETLGYEETTVSLGTTGMTTVSLVFSPAP